MEILLLGELLYLLIGIQIAGRMFYWDVRRNYTTMSSIICLLVVPVFWPFILILMLIDHKGAMADALWNWQE